MCQEGIIFFAQFNTNIKAICPNKKAIRHYVLGFSFSFFFVKRKEATEM